MSSSEVHAVVERVRSEFMEMPGLRLTTQQAARLWGLDAHTCRRVIDILVAAAFVRWTPAGMIMKATG
jgi:hypothetical protein